MDNLYKAKIPSYHPFRFADELVPRDIQNEVSALQRDKFAVETLITYSVEVQGRFVLVENVPARVDPETGEQFFSPDTVNRLHEIIRSGREPDHVIETPVFRFAA